MSTFKRVPMLLLVATLILTTNPLWGRVPIHPCLQAQPNRTLQAWQWLPIRIAEDGFRYQRPLCLDIWGMHTPIL